VVNQSTNNVTYRVRATQVLSNSIVRLANCVTYNTNLVASNAVSGGGVQYYVYTVSPNAVQANFEVFASGIAPGNVDLYVTKGLPLPSPTNWVAASQNPGTLSEFTYVNKSSVPTPLSAGDWYIAVVNKTANTLTYGVRVTEVAEGLTTLTRLTNGIPRTTTVTTNRLFADGKIDYFVFTVSTNSLWATFDIQRPTNTVMMVIRKGFPLPTRASSDYQSGIPGTGTNNPIIITTTNTPPLSPGDYYIGVLQTLPVNGSGTFNYTLTATEYSTPPPVLLSDCTPITNSLAGGQAAYYQFDVTTNSVQANFQILPTPTGNVDLYLKRGLPMPDVLNSAYSSTAPGTSPDMIRVTNNAPLNPLTAGSWYLAVVNKDPGNVNYVLSAGQFGPNSRIQVLASGQTSATKEFPWNGDDCHLTYYQYTFSSNAQWASFDLSGESAVMFASPALALPDPYSFAVSLTNSLSNHVSLTLTTNSTPIAIKPGSTWYFAIMDVGQTPNYDFFFKVTEFNSRPPIDLTNCITYTGISLSGTTDYYKFTVATNAVQANFEIINPSGNVDLFIIPKGLGLPGPQNNYYFSTQPGNADELIALTVNNPTNALAPGEWEIAVVNPTGSGNVQYRLMVSQFIPGQNILRLTNGVAYRSTAAAGLTNGCLVDYYVYTVSSNAARANFELFNLTADVNLYLRKGVPLPDPTKSHYSSANTGTNDEVIAVFPNSGPVALTPGDWYLGVAHTNTGPVVYSVKATEYSTAGTNLLYVAGSGTRTNGNFCMLWTNTLPGIRYHLEGKASLSLSNWSVASTTLTAAGSTFTTCVPTNTPYQFFRLAEGAAPAGSPFAPITPQKSFTAGKTTGAVLEWNAPTESRFVLEWSTNGTDWTAFPDVITSTNGVFQYFDESGQGRTYRITPGL
jgi:hypothetical protein